MYDRQFRFNFSYLSQILPDLCGTYESLMNNRRCWATLDSIIQEEGLPAAGGLDYLRDRVLETKVLERIDSIKRSDNGSSGKTSPSDSVSLPKKAKSRDPSEESDEESVRYF